MSKINSYNLNKIQDTLNGIHPKQIVNLAGNIKFSMFEVKYEYITNRDNKRTAIKYFLLNQLNPQADLKEELSKYVDDYNENNIHRQISNVKFLESKCIGYINI